MAMATLALRARGLQQALGLARGHAAELAHET